MSEKLIVELTEEEIKSLQEGVDYEVINNIPENYEGEVEVVWIFEPEE